MPQRSRSRRLDRIAKDAFRFRIPRHWSFRRIEPDYGIGGGVEILDVERQPTGVKCHVQVTGSDEPDLSAALTLVLRKEKVDYYTSLEPPVLMVRHHAPTGRFYARWALRCDPTGKRPTRPGRKSNSTVFTWAESDCWDERTASQLENDLRLMHELSGPGFSWPMRFTLKIETDWLSDIRKANVASAIRRQWSEISRYVSLVDEEAEAHGSITLSRTTIRAAIGGFHTAAVPLKEPYLAPENLHSMLSNALVLIAMALTRAGHAGIAARLCHLSFGSDAQTR